LLGPKGNARFGSSAVGCPRDSKSRRPNKMRHLRGREFGYEAVAPAILGIKERLHSGRELRLAVAVKHAGDGVEFGVAHPDLDLRLRLDVPHPVGASALGNKVEVPAMLGEPDLDFARLTRDAASGGQIEVQGTLSRSQHIAYRAMLTHFRDRRTMWWPRAPKGLLPLPRSRRRRSGVASPARRLNGLEPSLT